MRLNNNALTSLPAGVFSGLSSLTELYLLNNQLTSLPAEFFNSSGSLTTLNLYGNSSASFAVTFTPVMDDFNRVRVQMTPNAWTTLTVPLTASNGTLSSSSVVFAPGASLSSAVTFTPDGDSNTVSEVSVGTLPTLPTGFTA